MGYVYVYGVPGDLLVKVGYSGRGPALEEREMSLKRFWRGGRFLYVHESASQKVERRTHKLLKPRFWLDREWFVCGADVAVATVRAATRITGRERKEALRRYAAIRKRKRALRAGGRP